ncbi:hypothetical protein Mapa_010426 [Marchantia paleacea]|nr:hypothetical protein Mapa_010426 [Marchantia paleacea]
MVSVQSWESEQDLLPLRSNGTQNVRCEDMAEQMSSCFEVDLLKGRPGQLLRNVLIEVSGIGEVTRSWYKRKITAERQMGDVQERKSAGKGVLGAREGCVHVKGFELRHDGCLRCIRQQPDTSNDPSSSKWKESTRVSEEEFDVRVLPRHVSGHQIQRRPTCIEQKIYSICGNSCAVGADYFRLATWRLARVHEHRDVSLIELGVEGCKKWTAEEFAGAAGQNDYARSVQGFQRIYSFSNRPLDIRQSQGGEESESGGVLHREVVAILVQSSSQFATLLDRISVHDDSAGRRYSSHRERDVQQIHRLQMTRNVPCRDGQAPCRYVVRPQQLSVEWWYVVAVSVDPFDHFGRMRTSYSH